MNKQGFKKFADQLMNLESVKKIFPKDAIINTDNSYFSFSDGYKCKIDWELKNDDDRPSKRSKTIIVKIDSDGLADYIALQNKQKAQNSFIKEIEKKFKEFEPDHNNKRSEEPPKEPWNIPNNIINN